MSRLEQQRLYWVWADMVSRCRNPKHRQYKDYGGRGIYVCERWQKSANFIFDMAPRTPGGMLDRRDNDSPYSPDNCRWATRKEQNSNRRNCIYVTDRGERVTLREFCRRHDVRYRPIVKRIKDRGWPIGLAIIVPLGCDRNFFKIDQAAE